MKQLDSKKFETLFTIIKPYPSSHIFHIDDGNKELVLTLHKFAMDNELVYHLSSLDKDFLEYAKKELTKEKNFKIREFNFEQPRFNRSSILYDTAFLTLDLFKIPDLEDFLRKLYRIMKNAGDVIFFSQNENEKRTLILTLEKTNYVAINTIDDFNSFSIVLARKMHGWQKV